jgi:hypothetical protein
MSPLPITPEPDKSQGIYRICAIDANDSHLRQLIYLDYIRATRCRSAGIKQTVWAIFRRVRNASMIERRFYVRRLIDPLLPLRPWKTAASLFFAEAGSGQW